MEEEAERQRLESARHQLIYKDAASVETKLTDLLTDPSPSHSRGGSLDG